MALSAVAAARAVGQGMTMTGSPGCRSGLPQSSNY